MQPNSEHAQGDIARFAVGMPLIDSIKCVLKIKLSSGLKRKTSFVDVPLILSWIKGDAHTV